MLSAKANFIIMKKLILGLLSLTIIVSLFGCANENEPLASATIILAEKPESLDPYSAFAVDRQYTNPIYETLVTFDQELKIQPQLAYSFGKLNDNTWQFKIRSEVYFHDGTALTAQLVADNFAALKKNPPEHLSGLLRNISGTELTDAKTIVFSLTDPDPEFLRKLTQLPIVATADFASLLKSPNGTGPYTLLEQAERSQTYQAFNNYWNGIPKVNELTYRTAMDKDDRIKGTISISDVIATIPFPPSEEAALETTRLELDSQPDLTVNFFVWNPSGYWAEQANRQKLTALFPYDQIETLTGGQGTAAAQFVSTGVLGFNPELKPQLDKLEKRQAVIEELEATGATIRLAVPPELKDFGLELESQLNAVGLNGEAYIVESEQLFDRDLTEGVHLLFLGWRSDLGTSSNFFSSFFAENSKFNIADYGSEELEALLALLAQTYEDEERIKLLQDLNELVSLQDPFGLPLFYGRLNYAVSKDYKLKVRPDGIVLMDSFIN